jgi:hypothetical protein
VSLVKSDDEENKSASNNQVVDVCDKSCAFAALMTNMRIVHFTPLAEMHAEAFLLETLTPRWAYPRMTDNQALGGASSKVCADVALFEA